MYTLTYNLYSLALEESNIKNGGVEVDKLKYVHLSSKVIIKLCGCSMQFCIENNSEVLLHSSSQYNLIKKQQKEA